ncbi:MAG: dihydroorotate dehydrogenase electron transfer subunit [bacterium]
MREPGKLLCEAAVIDIKWLNDSYYTLRFHSPEMALRSSPGQFVNLKLSNVKDLLLRRPMSIYRCGKKEGWLEFLLKIVGRGTRTFSHVQPGDEFGLLGPLGRGFDFDDVNDAILVGGGIGIAPLVFLAEEMYARNVNVRFVQGFVSQSEMCCAEELTPFVEELQIATDDGSYGFHGDVVGLLRELIRGKADLTGAEIFACGPNVMMRSLAELCVQENMKAQFSVEAHMACGFGVCVGCPVPLHDRSGYYLACTDGPVFRLGDIDFAD